MLVQILHNIAADNKFVSVWPAFFLFVKYFLPGLYVTNCPLNKRQVIPETLNAYTVNFVDLQPSSVLSGRAGGT